jgi:excisionase family DNA binding protein
MNRPTVSVNEACALIGVSRRTIYNWIAAGKVEYVRTAGGSIRIFTDSLWRDANEQFPSRTKTGKARTPRSARPTR